MPSPPDAQRDAAPPRKAEYYAATRDWPGYFAVVAGRPPRETLLAALDAFDREGAGRAGSERFAIDLACGEGRDTVELLRRGWRVLAIDGHPEALERIRARTDITDRSRLELRLAAFEGLRLARATLLNCSFSLPFCAPSHFAALWEEIVRSLPAGGRFAGQLFGDRDDWAKLRDRSHQSRGEVERLLAPFDVEMLKEEEKDSNEPGENPKHWQVFHVVAKKK